jgi:hypothetical protein
VLAEFARLIWEAESTKETTVSFERDDIELVKIFLTRYKDEEGNAYNVSQRPDTVVRQAEAIEAIAVDEHSHTLAIEHTIVQAFEGKKADDVPFLTAFERLRLDKSLLLPDKFIDVQCPALVIPKGKGIVWNEVGDKVFEWFKDARHVFPAEGQSWHTIPNVGFDLRVLVETMEIPGTDGVVVVSRILPKERPFLDVLRKALTDKVPKLVRTTADKHILLLEDEGTAIGFFKIISGIESIASEVPKVNKVDEIWVVHTMSWKTSGDLFFCRVWPGGVSEKFHVVDSRFSRQPAPSKGRVVILAIVGLTLALGTFYVLKKWRGDAS